MGQYCFAGCRLSSSVTLPAGGPAGRRERGNAAWKRCRPAARRVDGRRAGGRARGRSGGRHCTAGQSCYVPLGRHLLFHYRQNSNITDAPVTISANDVDVCRITAL